MFTVSSGEKKFPVLLKEIFNPPKILHCRGSLDGLNTTCVAIVGTRKATENGLRIAKSFAKELATSGVTIISGLAMGIDTAAHEGALEAGGKTIAVLGNGIDWIYPRQNARLAEKIIESGGAAISEYPAGEPSYPANFLARNRIVSGLSVGVVVVEAPERSGSLATANFALEQNREVFVVPGPVGHQNYAGSHSLIRSGARLVAAPGDVLEDLGLAMMESGEANPLRRGSSEASRHGFAPVLGLTIEQEGVRAALEKIGGPAGPDKIEELTKMGIPDINRSLTYLLLKGVIREDGGLYHLQ